MYTIYEKASGYKKGTVVNTFVEILDILENWYGVNKDNLDKVDNFCIYNEDTNLDVDMVELKDNLLKYYQLKDSIKSIEDKY